ncbi:MAG: hypothetical protein ABI963_13305 [Rhizomicrobium sp.]
MSERWDWKLIVSASLFCALAFNLTFFAQELFLVIPKAMVPGLHVTLYHNNHNWTGDSPIVPLLQGTGAIADLLVGLVFAGLLAGAAQRSMTSLPSMTARLFLFWMAFQGIYQFLSQMVIGTILPQNDMGMALGYLGFSSGAKWATGLLVLVAMIGAGIWLMRMAIALIATSHETMRGIARLGFIFRTVTVPALLSVVVLIPFREPRNIVEVALIPMIVTVCGVLWIQLSAGFSPVSAQPTRPAPSIIVPLGALLLVLAFFQIVLRPGIAFS